MTIRLERPHAGLLDEYRAALQTGWSPSNTQDLSGPHLAAIATDPAAFLADYDWTADKTVTLPNGTIIPRLPGQLYWLSDGAFCGVLSFRYVPGTLVLPPQVAGHIGYTVVPWKRRQGVASEGLRAALPIARAAGLPKVLLTTSPGNLASQGVIRAAGGVRSPDSDGADDHGAYIGFWITTDPAPA